MSGMVISQTSINSLPREILGEVLKFLNFSELNAVSTVAKLWFKIARACQNNSFKEFDAGNFLLAARRGLLTHISFPANLLKTKVLNILHSRTTTTTPYDLSSYPDYKILAIQQNIKTACEEEKESPGIIATMKFKMNKATHSLILEIFGKFRIRPQPRQSVS